MYPGFPSRLEKEMKQLYLTRVLGGDGARLKVSSVALRDWPKLMRRTLRSVSRIRHDESTWSSWAAPCWRIS